MKIATAFIAFTLLAADKPDPAIAYLQAHARAVEASAAVDRLNAEYLRSFTVLRDKSSQSAAAEKAALADLAKHLGCADVDTEKLACKTPAPAAKP